MKLNNNIYFRESGVQLAIKCGSTDKITVRWYMAFI